MAITKDFGLVEEFAGMTRFSENVPAEHFGLARTPRRVGWTVTVQLEAPVT
jgi:hypothetical protein